jgi:peroxiredoxin
MKTLVTLGLAGLLICSSCQEKKEESGVAVLSGTISNHNEKDLKINDFLGKSEWSKVIEVSDNSFEETLDLEKPVMKMLQYDNVRKDIFIQPGKSLKVYFDANDIEKTFKYEGDLAMENSILDSVTTKLNSIDIGFVYSQKLEDAVKYLDSIKRGSKDLFRRLTAENPTSPEFIEYTTAFIDYKMAGLKVRAGSRNGEEPDNYYAFLEELTLTNPDLLDIGEYRMFLFSYINKEITLRLKKLDSVERMSPDAEFNERLAVIKQFENDDIRAYSLYNAMVMELRGSSAGDFEKHYDYFKKHNSNQHYFEQLEIAYIKKSKLAPGQPAPEFTLPDINDAEKRLSDFQGQYVLLDFWNSRCGRCRKELPYFMELQSDYENENIAFVTISNDPDSRTWKNYVKKNKNVGTSLWSEKFWDSETFKAYQVAGTPTYVLIDKEGYIIDPMAPKPSSQDLRDTLNKILEIQ